MLERNGMEILSDTLVSVFADPNFEARQRERERMLGNCPSIEWESDMGLRIPFCRKTGEFCDYCRKDK